jgi:signal transduction histidine kinase
MLQGIGVMFIENNYIAFTILYTTLVCVACSQLEKLKLALLNIRQTNFTSEQKCGDEIQQTDFREQPRPSDESFRHMQEQLNNCIRHHQQINR